MLDPVELAQGTVIRNLADADREGRRTWWATVSAATGYEPRCGCCPLIPCEGVARDEYGDDYVAPRDGFPEGFRIGLDVQTGVVVSSEPIGATSDSRIALTIHEVDGPVEVIDQVRVRPAVGQSSHTSAPHHGSAGGWAPYSTAPGTR